MHTIWSNLRNLRETTAMTLPFTKKQVHEECLRLVEEKINIAKQAMEAAQNSANNESKSSAGDKYETGRAMAQLEKDKSTLMLVESQKLKSALLQITLEKPSTRVLPGSLVITDQGIFYLAVGLGQIQLEGTSVFVLSPASPLGNRLYNLEVNGKASFNGKEYRVVGIG